MPRAKSCVIHSSGIVLEISGGKSFIDDTHAPWDHLHSGNSIIEEFNKNDKDKKNKKPKFKRLVCRKNT